MSTISVYTTTFNALSMEYCILEGVKSALCFADEIVVVDSGSTDGTIEALRSLEDERIKIYHLDWLKNIGWAMYKIIKSMAIGRCTSDWCVLMDADEVIHEKDFERIKRIPHSVSDNIVAVKFNTLHFYRDYKHLLNGTSKWKDLYTNKIYMVRNGLGIHHGNSGMDIDAHLDRHGMPIGKDHIVHAKIDMFHYGHVRSASTYLKKQNTMDSYYHGKEITRESVPWIEEADLTAYSDSHPCAMKSTIAERIARGKV